jgi:hypothetical protein
MLLSTRTALFGIILLGGLVGGPARIEASAEVRDDRLQLFSPEARGRARDAIQEIERSYHVKLVIETEDRGRRPLGWLFPKSATSNKAGRNGIYVLISREVSEWDVHVTVGPDPRVQEAFPPAARAQLRDQLLSRLKEKHADQGLSEALQFVRSTLDAHLGGPIAPPQSFDWTPITTTLLVILGLWLLIEVLQVATGGQLGAGYVGLSAGSFAGGGSFVTGLFAAMAGSRPRDVGPADEWLDFGPFVVPPQPSRLEEHIRPAEAPGAAPKDLNAPAHDLDLDRYDHEPSEHVHGEHGPPS